MKIEYSTGEDNKYPKIFDEALGVFYYRRRFRRDKNTKLRTMSSRVIKSLIFYLFIIAYCFIFYFKMKVSFALFGAIIMILVFLYNLIYYGSLYIVATHKKSSKSVLELSEEGLKDSTNDESIQYSWNKYDFVVFGEHAITFILKDGIMFQFFPISISVKLKTSLQEYAPELVIIDTKKES